MKNLLYTLILIIIICISFNFIDYGEVFTDFMFYVNKDKVVEFNENMKINDLEYESNYYYYKNNLTESQQTIYASISEGVKNLNNRIDLYGYEEIDQKQILADVEKSLEVFLLDHPEVFYLENKFEIQTTVISNVTLPRIILYYTIEDKYELKNIIYDINKELNRIYYLKPNNTSLDVETFFYEYLSSNVIYDPAEEVNSKSHTIQGTLLSKKAVCDGYTKVMQILLQKSGIDNIMVTGWLNKTAHAWNMVRIDGNWYHTDITSSKISENIISHAYLNISEYQITDSHTINMEYSLPKAKYESLNYFKYNDYYIARKDNLSDKLSDIINKQKSSKYLELEADVVHSISEIINELYELDYHNLKSASGNDLKIDYYEVLDTYIILD